MDEPVPERSGMAYGVLLRAYLGTAGGPLPWNIKL